MGKKKTMINNNFFKNNFKKNIKSLSTYVHVKALNRDLGRQYAKALLEIAQSNNILQEIKSDVEIINNLIKENNGFSNVMVNPLVSGDKKTNLINKISSGGTFNKFTKDFLLLLVDMGRIDCIAEALEAFESLYCQATDTQIATVKSAVALEDSQQLLVAQKIQKLAKSEFVKIIPVIDESLIAGLVIKYGSSQVDLSIRGAFEDVKKELSIVSI